MQGGPAAGDGEAGGMKGAAGPVCDFMEGDFAGIKIGMLQGTGVGVCSSTGIETGRIRQGRERPNAEGRSAER